jgi:membrane-bound ClpP family serine protease
MGIFINIVFLVVSVIALAISAGFCANSAVRLQGADGYNTNSDIGTAHKWLSWGAVAGWIGVAIIILCIILYLIFGSETVEATGNLFIYGMLFLSLAATIVVGVFSAMGAYYINKANVQNNNGAYKTSIIAAVLGIVAFTFILITFLIKMFYHPKKKEETSKEDRLAWMIDEMEEDPELAGAVL